MGCVRLVIAGNADQVRIGVGEDVFGIFGIAGAGGKIEGLGRQFSLIQKNLTFGGADRPLDL